MSRLTTVWIACLAIILAGRGAAQDDKPKTPEDRPKDEQAERAKERLTFMLNALGEYSVKVDEEDTARPVTLLSTPALRWSNSVSSTDDGIVGVWTSGGRPEVVAQFSGPKAWVYEFCSTSLLPVNMSRSDRVVWAPKAAGVTLAPIPKSPAPAESDSRRLSQMRKLAERFEVEDDFHPIYGKPEIERHTLRLLPQPLYRYTPTGDLIDGALFGLVISTDPEALLMIEAYKTDKGTEWRYALARMTVYALRAKLDGAEVWSAPEKLAGQWLFGEPYYVGLFQ
jgi:hypothetical protein